jgi:hypothetical protein
MKKLVTLVETQGLSTSARQAVETAVLTDIIETAQATLEPTQ